MKRSALMTTGLAPGALLLGVSVSFGVWIVSANVSLQGIPSVAPTVGGALAVITFYGALLVATAVGSVMGEAVAPSRRLSRASWTTVYLRLSLVAMAGVALTYLLATKGSIEVLIDLIRTQQFNRLRSEVPLSAGLSTLRYATIPAGGMALYRVVHERRASWLEVGNIVALLLASAFSSRLTLVAATAVGVYLLWADPSRRGASGPTGRRSSRRSRRRIIRLVLLGLLAMLALNYIRNANYYRTVEGTSNPVTMLRDEVIRYVSVPARVGVGVEQSDSMSSLSGRGQLDSFAGIAHYAKPSYATADKTDGTPSDGTEAYRDVVDVAPSLTTNSVLAEAAGTLGGASVPILATLLLLAAMLCSHFARYRSPAVVVAPIIAYGFLELWRIWLFNTGILHFAVLAILLLCWTSTPARRDLFPGWSHVNGTTPLRTNRPRVPEVSTTDS